MISQGVPKRLWQGSRGRCNMSEEEVGWQWGGKGSVGFCPWPGVTTSPGLVFSQQFIGHPVSSGSDTLTGQDDTKPIREVIGTWSLISGSLCILHLLPCASLFTGWRAYAVWAPPGSNCWVGNNWTCAFSQNMSGWIRLIYWKFSVIFWCLFKVSFVQFLFLQLASHLFRARTVAYTL